MIKSATKYQEPQMNADERRFVVPALCQSVLLIDSNQKNLHFFAPFAYFAVKNSANFAVKINTNPRKPPRNFPPNTFKKNLKIRVLQP